MKSGSDGSKEDDASGGGHPRNGNGKPPHWKRRESTATAVYVVHPALFRTVVQQLTGPTLSPPPPHLSTQAHADAAHQHEHVAAGGGGGNGAGAGTRSNAAAQVQAQAQAQQQQGGGRAEESSGGGSRGRTLGQMHQDCLAWAKNADDN